MKHVYFLESIVAYVAGCCIHHNINPDLPNADALYTISALLAFIGLALLVIAFHKYYALRDEDEDDN